MTMGSSEEDDNDDGWSKASGVMQLAQHRPPDEAETRLRDKAAIHLRHRHDDCISEVINYPKESFFYLTETYVTTTRHTTQRGQLT